ncbi:SWIM zinc finger family protein [Streptomyces sp. NPDC057456]|uniref:SWIM zinc finger family protein n=1 Tax=Streptomyces sp. NPDC057456 TaxID=3346139 RepID=UPI0036B5272D
MGETEKTETPAESTAESRAGSTAETAAAVTAGERREKAAGPADEARRALRAARERTQEHEPTQGPSHGLTNGPSPESSVWPEGPALRPGDAARAALRRTAESAPPADAVTVADPPPVEAAGADDAAPTTAPTPPANPTPTDPTPSTPTSSDASPATPTASDPTPADAEPRAPQAGTGSRPGDIAREALRAARAETRQGPAEPRTRAGRRTPRGDGGLRPRADARPTDARPTDARPTDARPTDARRHGSAHDRVADERARVVRELLAGAFQMPSEDTAGDEVQAEVRAAGEAEGQGEGQGEGEVQAEGQVEGETGPGLATTATASASATAGSSPEGSPFAAPVGSAPASPLRLPEPPHTPRTMAAPARDGEHRRTFPAFPPRSGGSFAGTWWGNAWVTALEEGALDPARLARGRGYAERGNVDAITVTPGLVLAYVQGSRPRPYRVQVRLRTLGGEDWERFLEAAVERPGHIAALLDKEMPESLAECGVPLLPGPGDLEPQCSCPDRGHPCKHAAALCYQTARLLDADPFVLLLLRGRGEREVLDALSRRNATRAARAAQEQEPEPLPGVRAAEALAERRLPPLPAPLPVPPHPEQPPAYPSAPNGPDSFALDHLATDAAARAHALLTTGHDEIGELDLWRDAVRLAASRPGSGLTVTTRALYAALAAAVGRTPSDLARAVAAWRQGGPDGLTVLEETWDPPAGRFDRARPLLLAADLPAFRPRRNHLTHPRGHVQLRFGRDGLWYAYESEPGHDDWWPRGTPDPDPVGALTGLGGSGEL